MALQITQQFQMFSDVDGSPLNNGYIYIGTQNLNPETNPVACYWDQALTLPAAQPLRTSGGYIIRSGHPANVYTNTAGYSITVRNANSGLVYTEINAFNSSADHISADDGAGGTLWTTVQGFINKILSSAGSSVIGFLAFGVGAVIRTIQDKLREQISVKDFGAVCNGITDDTAAIQVAINAYSTTGARLLIPGNCKLGALTFPAGKPYSLEAAGDLTLTTTLVLPSGVYLKGIGSSSISQFARGNRIIVNAPAGAISAIKITGLADHLIENIHIPSTTGPGIELNGETALGALCTLRNVSIISSAVATSLPVLVRTWFWLWIENCSFVSLAGDYGYSISLENVNIASGGYTGLVSIKDSIISGHGIQIKNTQINAVPSFEFHNITYENGLNDFLTVNNTGGTVGQIHIDNCEIADAVGTVHLINVTGSVLSVAIDNMPPEQCSINPASGVIRNLYINSVRRFGYVAGISAIYPVYTNNYYRRFGDAIDAKLINENLVPATLPYAPLPVVQTASTWVGEAGGVVTAGKLAPDGTATAALLAGTAGGQIRVYDQAYTPALGDWFIVGAWVRSTDITLVPSRMLFNISNTSVKLNGSTAWYSYIGESEEEHIKVLDKSWKFMCTALKVTDAGIGAANVQLFLLYDSPLISSAPSEWWMPGIILIPASAGFSDYDVIRLSRGMKTMPNAGSAGSFALLNHQTLQLGGGARLFSASAAPTTGTWKQGDRVTNSAATVGQPKGWLCTVAGTPGTWVSEGVL